MDQIWTISDTHAKASRVCALAASMARPHFTMHSRAIPLLLLLAALPIVCLFITFCILLQNIRHHRDSERRAEQEAEERQAKKRAKESKEATPQPVSAARLEGLKPTMTTLTVVVRE